MTDLTAIVIATAWSEQQIGRSLSSALHLKRADRQVEYCVVDWRLPVEQGSAVDAMPAIPLAIRELLGLPDVSCIRVRGRGLFALRQLVGATRGRQLLLLQEGQELAPESAMSEETGTVDPAPVDRDCLLAALTAQAHEVEPAPTLFSRWLEAEQVLFPEQEGVTLAPAGCSADVEDLTEPLLRAAVRETLQERQLLQGLIDELQQGQTALLQLPPPVAAPPAEPRVVERDQDGWNLVDETTNTPLATDYATPAIELLGRSDTSPHRELLLQVGARFFGDEQVGTFRAKLVEHLDKPGLLLFAGPGRPVLSRWSPTGQEGGSDLMLLVPSDPAIQRWLLDLGTFDWLRVLGVTDGLYRLLLSRPDLGPRWQVVAASLRAQLHALPARLRYDERRVAASGERVTLHNVSWSQQRLPDLAIEWRGAAPGGAAVRCERLTDALPWPLLRIWPIGDDGKPARQWELPLGSGIPFREQLRWWTARDHGESRLVMALLDTLPPSAAGLRRRARLCKAITRVIRRLQSRPQ